METGWKVLIVILLFLFGSMLIANGACTIEWTRMGGIVVNGKKDVVTTDGATVEVATKEEEELIEKDRKGFVQAMSAINILAGIFLFILAGYIVFPNQYESAELRVRGKNSLFKGSRSAADAARAAAEYNQGQRAIRLMTQQNVAWDQDQ